MALEGTVGPEMVEGTLCCEDREAIFVATRCSAAVRARGNRPRCLTIRGPCANLDRAYVMAFECMRKNEGKQLAAGGGSFHGSAERWEAGVRRRMHQESAAASGIESPPAQQQQQQQQHGWEQQQQQQHGWEQHGWEQHGWEQQQQHGWWVHQARPTSWWGHSEEELDYQEIEYWDWYDSRENTLRGSKLRVYQEEQAAWRHESAPWARKDLHEQDWPTPAGSKARAKSHSKKTWVPKAAPKPEASPACADAEAPADAGAGPAPADAEAGPAPADAVASPAPADAEAGPAPAERPRTPKRKLIPSLAIMTYGLKQDGLDPRLKPIEDRLGDLGLSPRSTICIDARGYECLHGNFDRGTHIGTNTEFMSRMLEQECTKVEAHFKEAADKLSTISRQETVSIIVYCDHGKHRSVALAQLLREAIAREENLFQVEALQHLHKHKWSLKKCGHRACKQCDDTEHCSAVKTELYCRAHKIFSRLWQQKICPWRDLQ